MEERQVGSLRFYLDLSQPIYEQILQQMSSAVARGDLSLGDKVPSVREMAQGLRVTPNTVMHAYQEMERHGLTETRRGQGTFITKSRERVNQFRDDIAAQIMSDLLSKMKNLGYSWVEIQEFLDARREGERKS